MHTITIECDNCGHQAHFTGRFTDAQDAVDHLMEEELWQGVTYHQPEALPEIYCPACRLTPYTERDPDTVTADDILRDIAYACAHESITVAYNLCDRLYAFHERDDTGEESTHAAAD